MIKGIDLTYNLVTSNHALMKNAIINMLFASAISFLGKFFCLSNLVQNYFETGHKVLMNWN